MALLKPRLLFNLTRRSLGSSQALGAYWNKDWQPGQFPLTEEEKRAAAKKYGLMREEYEPVPDDGNGAGDYPGFKPYSVDGRDPFYPWDYPEYRRNFNEAIHEDFNIYTQDRFDVDRKFRYPLWLMISSFLGVMGGLWYIASQMDYTFFLPAKPKQLAAPGVTHYKYPQK